MTVFIPNPLVEEEIKREPLMKAELARLAQEGLDTAQRLVPIGETHELYDSLHIEETEDGYRVVAGTDHWLFPEYGTFDQAPQPYLRPIIDALGLRR